MQEYRYLGKQLRPCQMKLNNVVAVLRMLVGLRYCPVETSIFKAVFLWRIKMNQHVSEYHYYIMCKHEKSGDMNEAMKHLRLMWLEIQSNG